jgi:hypothetical protein
VGNYYFTATSDAITQDDFSTAVNQAVIENQTRKFIHDGQLFITRKGVNYTILGLQQ